MSVYRRFLPYGVAIASTAIATLLSLLLKSLLAQSIGILFVVAVTITTWYGGLQPGFVAIVLSTLTVNYFFVSPVGDLTDLTLSDLIRFLSFSLVAVVIHGLGSNLRASKRQVEQLSQKLLDESAERLQAALLEAEVSQALLEQQFQQQRLVMEMSQRIQRSLNLHDILQTTVDEVRQFLQVDRVIVFRFTPGWGGNILVESVVDEALAILPFDIHDPCIGEQYVEPFQQGCITAKSDIYTAGVSPCHVQFLEQFQVRANLVVPILKNDTLWGLLAVHHCQSPRQWQESEIDLLRQIASQVSISLQQAALFEQVQTELNERKQAEAALRASQIQLQQQLAEIEAIYQSAPVGLNVLDTNLRFIRINQRLAEINGLPVEAHIGHSIRELLPDLADTSEQILRPILETGEPLLNVEITGETPAQPGVQRVWLESFLPLKHGDRIIGISTVCEDITERRQAEQTLAKELLRIQTLFKTSFDGILILDRSGKVIDANPRFAEMLGYTPKEITSLTVFDFDIHFTPAELQQLLDDTLNAQKGVFETRYRRKDHSICDVEVSYNIVAWGDEVIRFSACRDISERKRSEAERKQAQIELEQLNAELEQRIAERTADLTALNHRLIATLLEQEHAKREIEDLYNNAPCGYHSLNAEGTFVRINDTELNWLGYRRDEILHQKTLFDLLASDRQKMLDEFIQFKQQGWINDIEIQLTRKDGSTRWFSLNATALRDEAGNFVMSRASLFDISDRKLTEIALQQQTQEEQLRWNITQAIRQSLDLRAILSTTVNQVRQTLQADRVAVYRFLPDWSGDFIAESVSDVWVKLVEPGVQKIWQDTYLQETQGGRFQNHETFVVADIYTADLQPCHIQLLEQFEAKAYAVAPIFSGATLWGLIAIYQNTAARQWQSWEIELLQQISSQLAIAIQQSELYGQLQLKLQERQQTEAVLREAERRWRSLLENVKLIVVELNQVGQINYVNPFFLNLTGYTETEILGKNWFETFLPSSRQQTIQTVFSEVICENAHPHYKDYILTKTGETRFIAWNNTRLRDSDGNITGTVSIGEDVTERQKVEKMKDEFIGIVSHELRTPLTAIQMSLGLLKTGVYAKKPEKAQRMIDIALIDTNRLVNLVNDILDLERLESGRTVLEKTVCRAMDLMQQAVDGVQAIATQQHITLTIISTEITVWAAADAILQTLTNLLSNAIKFSPVHSEIQLQAEFQVDHVLFQVSDQGRGIPADKLETIFGRFQQVDVSDAREKGGTGLGLPICRSIVERHGGRIWAESTLGEGSTFFFTLPLPSDSHL